MQDADIGFAQAKDLSAKWLDHYQRRMNHSHKRYLSALKTLALVRKLAVPVLQVNIAKKQINVAGTVIGKEGDGTVMDATARPASRKAGSLTRCRRFFLRRRRRHRRCPTIHNPTETPFTNSSEFLPSSFACRAHRHQVATEDEFQQTQIAWDGENQSFWRDTKSNDPRRFVTS